METGENERRKSLQQTAAVAAAAKKLKRGEINKKEEMRFSFFPARHSFLTIDMDSIKNQ